jgi:hypothetical protein
MSSRFGALALITVVLGMGMLYSTEVFFRDIAHVDDTGLAIAWIPVIVSAVPLLIFVVTGRHTGMSRKARAFAVLGFFLLLVFGDFVLLLLWSCLNGVCI